jgi:hypothetical protein
MKKIILAVASITALAATTLAPVASANVPRCAAPVTEAATATFSVWQPAHAVGQWIDTYRHDYTVTVQPNGSFTGTGLDHNFEAEGNSETITGTYNTDGTVSFTATADPQVTVASYSVNNAPMNGSLADASSGTTTVGTSNPSVGWALEYHVTPWIMSAPTTTDLNHGQYVKSQGGGKEAAQACAGMPLNSTQGH